jgi:hypothetical protein
MAEPPDQSKSRDKRPNPPQQTDEKARFAKAMARAELGRHYWSEAAERALREAMARKPKR